MELMLKIIWIAVLAALTGAAAAGAAPRAWTPTGATLEPSGFATVITAPPSRAIRAKPAPQPAGEAGWYARERGISQDEAMRRISAQQAIMSEFETLIAKLRAREPDNYTDARMIHDPDWAYVLYFKRAPAATLAKYTSNPRFKAAQARYSRAELDAMLKPWVERFTTARILGGYGTDATYGTAEMMMAVTRSEYEALAQRNGWGWPPEPIKLQFAGELTAPAVDPRVSGVVRAFANEPYATVIQLEALGTGRIVMRDGCLRVDDGGKHQSLAYFHRETGIGLDDAGYLALIDRRTGKASGRVGEMFAWGAPNAVPKDDPGVALLKAKCGDLPILNVGNPESKAVFDARHPR